jgi:2-dehydropantoate 2-reductase
MKILIIGAGVLGSYLAHVLLRGGNQVTLLARGQRKMELQSRGLVIRHVLQLQTTHDEIILSDTLAVDDAYDVIFVVVRRNQLDDLLQNLCANQASPILVIIGNNVNANEIQTYIRRHSKTEKKILFGFQGSGGRREQGRIISLHFDFKNLGGRMILGSLEDDVSAYPVLTKAFAQTNYKLIFNANMDGWLKSHAAFILPLCFAVYFTNGNLRKIAHNKEFLNRLIDCIDEAYQIIQACDYALEPASSLNDLRNKRRSTTFMFKFLASMPIGRLAVSDHAMAAKDEMRRLYDDFCLLKNKAGIATPNWDELETYMPPKSSLLTPSVK